MTEPYLGEIQLFAFNYAPRGWMLCQGQTLQTREYAALFALLGTMYGGDGRTTFMLPDLRGRSPVNWGAATTTTSAYTQGKQAGAETVTITAATLPAHTHVVSGYSDNGTTSPGGANYFAQPVISTTALLPQEAYVPPNVGNPIALNPAAVSSVGGGQPHDNMQPYLTLNYCIAVTGIFPPRN